MHTNILFLFPDQHHRDWMTYNKELPIVTPNIDRLMKEGTTFTRCYTSSPVCAPARACLASGMDYQNCRVRSNGTDYPLDLPTYYQSLQKAGYNVAGVGKFDLHKPKQPMNWNLDGSRCLDEWGFTHGIDNEGKLDGSNCYSLYGGPQGPYLDFLKKRGKADIYVNEHKIRKTCASAYITELDEDEYCDNWVGQNGLDIIRDLPKDTPWHLVVNFTGPHEPMDVTKRMADRWKDVEFPPPHKNEQEDYTAEDHQRNRQYYSSMIENVDRNVGLYLDLLEERGELENTVIIYSSDHGDMLGDHNRWHKSIHYEASIGIPLVI
ncbi:MAG: sulfatase family protein, partial [Planctomycetota bacterium]